MIIPLVEKPGDLTKLSGSPRRARVGWRNPSDVLVTIGNIQQPFPRPAMGEQLVLREIGGSFRNPRRLPAEELAGLFQARSASHADASRQIDLLERLRKPL